MIANTTTQSQILLSNISRIIEFNTSKIIENIELRFDQYISAINVVLNNSTYYTQSNSTIGIATKPVPKGYVPVILITYIIYAVFMVIVLAQLLIMIHSAYARLRVMRDAKPTHISNINWLPLVSIIIPVRGEGIDAIEDAVKRITGLDYPRDKLEVIVATDDDEATANLIKNSVERIGKTYGLRTIVNWRSKPVGYKGGAINEAAKLARGDVLLILDVDTILPRNYLKVALSYLNEGYDAVGAPFLGVPKVPNNFSWPLMILFNTLSEVQIVGRALSRFKRGFYMIIGNNLLIRRDFFNRINGLCYCKSDDIDVALRIWLMGGRIGVMNERVLTEIPSTYDAFRSQTIRWATNDMWALKKYFTKILKSRNRSLVDKVDAYLWLLKYPLVYLGVISIITMIIMQVFNILIPPLPILVLSVLTDVVGAALLILIIMVGRRMNYSYWDLFKSLVIGGLTMYALAFPLMIYLAKALLSDLPWLYTPKASKALLRQKFLIERLSIIALIAVGAALLMMGHVIVSLYVFANSILILMGYSVGTVKPSNRLIHSTQMITH
ncbi:glycosyltransferase [Caldivirga maquilingensis]|uniref:Glycosyl transferase family 2 n=1 Tax=Caldivirga maquilingensis (strain ATCC 700844 / DSM 13496 / JCM 10307 / IC-167) TaxID=397948 RepID=A8MA07_CALMQ|nr:glycosyltransferase family 2 protein [Caldivirga maquilingensis]ABW02478.1 glycosyl transferase family 2 [Caldivirga maquilingensis IC-167]